MQKDDVYYKDEDGVKRWLGFDPETRELEQLTQIPAENSGAIADVNVLAASGAQITLYKP